MRLNRDDICFVSSLGQKKILAVETPNDELGHYLIRLYFAEISNVESFV